jgi:hypothetical protein
MGAQGPWGGDPPPLAYMCSVHSNSKNYKIEKISLIKLNCAAALIEWFNFCAA